MDSENAKLILKAIESSGHMGSGILSIANKTKIHAAKVRQFLNENKDMVCHSRARHVYTLNRFGPYKGSVQDMLKAVQATIDKGT